MTIKILVFENGEVVDFSKANFIFNKLENEFGDYYDVFGELIFLENDSEFIKIKTNTLIADIYGLFYSINDYLEFKSVEVAINEESESIKYEGVNGKILLSRVKINEIDFLNEVLDKSHLFFSLLYSLHSNNEYEMYLNIINNLKMRI